LAFGARRSPLDVAIRTELRWHFIAFSALAIVCIAAPCGGGAGDVRAALFAGRNCSQGCGLHARSTAVRTMQKWQTDMQRPSSQQRRNTIHTRAEEAPMDSGHSFSRVGGGGGVGGVHAPCEEPLHAWGAVLTPLVPQNDRMTHACSWANECQHPAHPLHRLTPAHTTVWPHENQQGGSCAWPASMR
jgi:hypothetical protein